MVNFCYKNKIFTNFATITNKIHDNEEAFNDNDRNDAIDCLRQKA